MHSYIYLPVELKVQKELSFVGATISNIGNTPKQYQKKRKNQKTIRENSACFYFSKEVNISTYIQL